MKVKYIWTIEEDDKAPYYFTKITAVRKAVHLLVSAGFNELYDDDDDGFEYQVWEKDGVTFTVERQIINLPFSI